MDTVKLMPMPDFTKIARWCDDATQTVGIYPNSLRLRVRDILALAGVQWMKPALPFAGKSADPQKDEIFPGMPHDGIENFMRSVRWVIDQAVDPETEVLAVVLTAA